MRHAWASAVGQAKDELGHELAQKAIAAERAKTKFQQQLKVASNRSVLKDASKLSLDHDVSWKTDELDALGRWHNVHKRACTQTCAMASGLRKWLTTISQDGQVGAKSLDLTNQNAGDFTVETLCEHFRERVAKLEELHLANNVLTDRSMTALAGAMKKDLRLLNLNENRFSQSACAALVGFLQAGQTYAQATLQCGSLVSRLQPSDRKLQVLNLSKNAFGDVAITRLCTCLTEGGLPELVTLSLAETQIGRSIQLGSALRDLLATHTVLSNLDLNFNFFQGQTAYDLFFGVYENEHSGQLKNLDVSWNQLSVSFSWRTAQMLATVVRDNSTLTHLDLSYNKLNMQDMKVIVEAAQQNSVARTINFMGNAIVHAPQNPSKIEGSDTDVKSSPKEFARAGSDSTNSEVWSSGSMKLAMCQKGSVVPLTPPSPIKEEIHAEIASEMPSWTFEESVWAPWADNSQGLVKQCFDKDMSLLSVKLAKVLRPSEFNELCKLLQSSYHSLCFLYHQLAFIGLADDKSEIGVQLREWTSIADYCFPEKLQRRDTDTIFIKAQCVPFQMAKDLQIKKKGGPLLRYQLVEAILRCAQMQYCDGCSWQGILVAAELTIAALHPLVNEMQESLKSRREELFCERCHVAMHKELSVMQTVFDHYRVRYHVEKPDKRGMLVASWIDMLRDANAFDDKFKPKDASVIFGSCLSFCVDEYAEDRRSEIHFNQWLICIGLAVRARKSYVKNVLAECIDEFISESVWPLYEKVQEWQGNPAAGRLPGFDLPAAWLQDLSSTLRHTFAMADDDFSGELSRREFLTAFGSKAFKEKIVELGLELPMLGDLFKRLDVDQSGEISFLEALEGLAKIKEQHKNDERVIRVLRNIFELADTDKGGSLSREEFLAGFKDPTIQQLVSRNGIGFGSEDLEHLFRELNRDGDDEVSLHEIIEGYLKIRDPERSGDRIVCFLQRLFAEADVDSSGTLTKAEFVKAVKEPHVEKQMQRLGLFGKDWNADALRNFFSQLDDSGDGILTLDELLDGYHSMREIFRQRTLAEEQHHWSKAQGQRSVFKPGNGPGKDKH